MRTSAYYEYRSLFLSFLPCFLIKGTVSVREPSSPTQQNRRQPQFTGASTPDYSICTPRGLNCKRENVPQDGLSNLQMLATDTPTSHHRAIKQATTYEG